MRTFKALLGESDPKAVLAFLNGLTPHRFTALFAIEGEDLRTVCVFDRDAPLAEFTGTIPVQSSYCLYVRNGESPFAVENSLADARVVGHVKREEYQSYLGVAVRDDEDRLLGTLCHFDVGAVSLEKNAGEFLKQAAPLVAAVIRDSRGAP